MKRNRILLATFVRASLVVVGLAFGSVAFAQTNLITNGGFESNPGGGQAPTGWTKDFNSHGAWSGNGGTMKPRTGSWVMHVGAGGASGGEFQNITTAAGRSYLVTLWLQGWADSGTGYDPLMRQQGSLVVGGTGSSAVVLGSNQLASGTSTLAVSNATVTNFLTQARISGVTSNSSWYAQASSFTATDTTTRVGLYNVSIAPFAGAVNVDDLGVYAANDWVTNAASSWSTASNWADGAAPNAAGAIAAFSGTATAPRTITVDTAATVGALIFRNANAYTLSGANTLTLSGTYASSTGPVVTVNSGSHTIATAVAVSGTLTPIFAIDQNTRLTVSGNVSGSTGIVKSGYGSLVLSGSNTYTGPTNITNGMVQFGTKAALYGGGTASWTPANISVGASGVLGLNVGGAGELNAADLGAILTSLGTINNNGLQAGSSIALDTSNTGTFTYASAIVNSTGTGGGAIGLTKLGSGVLALSGANNYTGATTVSGGMLQLGDGGTTGAISASSTVTVAAGATLAFNRTDTYGGNFTNAIGGAGGVTVRQGALTLSASNTFSGTTRIAAGSLTVANANALRNSTLDLNSADSGTIAAINQNSTLGGLAGSRSLDMGGRTLVIGGNNQSTTYSGALSNGVLTKNGTGQLTLSGSNTLSGTFTHQSGQTVLGRSGGPSLFASGSAGAIVITNAVGGGGAFWSSLIMGAANQLGSTVDVTMQQQNIYLGLTYFELRGTETTIGNLSAPISYPANTSWAIIENQELGSTVPGRLTVNQTVSGTFVGEFRDYGGAIGLTKNGPATLTLTSAGGAGINYTGTTVLNSGTLRLADATNFRSNTAIAGGATLEIANSGAQTIAAVLSGSGSVVKTAAGALTLSGSNTYTGQTRVSAGVLALGATDSISNQSSLLVDGGGFNLAGFNDMVGGVTITSGSIYGAGMLTAATYGLGGGRVAANLGAGTLTVTANSSLDGSSAATAVNLNAGALTLGSGGRFTASSVAVSGSSGASLTLGGNEAFGSLAGAANIALGGSTLSVGAANTDTTYSGVLSGAGGLMKVGSGVFTLANANTYSGNTVITGSGSVLKLGVAGSFANSPVIVVGDATSAGAVLDLTAKSGTFAIGNGQTLKGGGVIQMAAGTVLDMQGTFTPGNSPGLFTYDGGTTLLSGTTIMEIFGESRATLASHGNDAFYDAINVVNGGTLTFGGLLTLDITGIYADNTIFNLFSASGMGSSLTGNFSNIEFAPSSIYSSLTFTSATANPKIWTSSTTTSGQSFTFDAAVGTLVVVPEPSTVIVAGIGIAMAGWSLRKHRRLA